MADIGIPRVLPIRVPEGRVLYRALWMRTISRNYRMGDTDLEI